MQCVSRDIKKAILTQKKSQIDPRPSRNQSGIKAKRRFYHGWKPALIACPAPLIWLPSSGTTMSQHVMPPSRMIVTQMSHQLLHSSCFGNSDSVILATIEVLGTPWKVIREAWLPAFCLPLGFARVLKQIRPSSERTVRHPLTRRCSQRHGPLSTLHKSLSASRHASGLSSCCPYVAVRLSCH